MLLLFFPAASLFAKKTPPPPLSDVRVVIDISGSMKKNDPQNLRRSALRLLVGLMPKDGRGGVWTFGQYVNMPVPLGYVSDGWKAQARERAERIHSRGLFTNIEEAFNRATKDWEGEPTRFRRDVILLTDGMVDVSKDVEKNAASRKRILSNTLPRLEKLGARIHTIALSERADHDLMRKLSAATDGRYEQVDSADRLQRVFLRIFEEVGKPDTVPLLGNTFRIDTSIKEATLLVFRKKDASQPTKIISPSGKVFGINNTPKSIVWHQDEGYDLLTMSRPEPGEWHIQAEVDPDNRVMIVTDLRMHSTDLASRVSVGERLPFIIQFSDHGKKITRADFLKMVEIKSEYQIGDTYSEPRPIRDDGRSGDKKALDGTFSAVVGQGIGPGKSELVVVAEGKTFMRERRQAFEVMLPVKLSVSKKSQDGKNGVELVLQPDETLIQTDSMSPAAWLEADDGERAGIFLVPDGTGSWQGWVDTSGLTERQQLRVRMTATSVQGNWVELDLDPVIIGAELSPPPVAPVTEAPVPEKKPEPPKLPKNTEVPSETEESESEGMKNVLLFGGGNLLIILLAAVGYWFYKKRKESGLVQLIDDEAMDDEVET